MGFAFWYFTFGTFSGRYGLFVEDMYVEPRFAARGSGWRCSATWRASRWRGTVRHDMARARLEHAGDRVLSPYRRETGARLDPEELSGAALTALAEGARNG